MPRYQIWNKADNIYTPSGEVFTAAQWIQKYPFCNIPTAKPVISGGIFNGGFIGELSAMVDMYTRAGADFAGAETFAEKLAVIEAFEDNPPEGEASIEERTAAALELIAINGLPDEST